MASVYCQELIRNSKTLCEAYIGEILKKKEQKQKQELNIFAAKDKDTQSEKKSNDKGSNKDNDDDLGNKLKENYYLEDDEKLLNVLIQNCHPILTDML